MQFLVCINDKPHSRTALKYACFKAKESGAQVHMLHVIDEADYKTVMPFTGGIIDAMENEAQHMMDKYQQEVASWGVPKPEFTIRTGSVSEEIVDEVENNKRIALLVLGVCGEGRTKGGLLPALSEAIGEDYHVPLIIVPSNLTDAQIVALFSD